MKHLYSDEQTLFEFFLNPLSIFLNKEIIDRLGGIKDVRRKAITMDQIADFLNFEAHILSNQNNINVFMLWEYMTSYMKLM